MNIYSFSQPTNQTNQRNKQRAPHFTLVEFAREVGVTYNTLKNRIRNDPDAPIPNPELAWVHSHKKNSNRIHFYNVKELRSWWNAKYKSIYS